MNEGGVLEVASQNCLKNDKFLEHFPFKIEGKTQFFRACGGLFPSIYEVHIVRPAAGAKKLGFSLVYKREIDNNTVHSAPQARKFCFFRPVYKREMVKILCIARRRREKNGVFALYTSGE